MTDHPTIRPGQRYGRHLTVERWLPTQRTWLCRCTCGNTRACPPRLLFDLPAGSRLTCDRHPAPAAPCECGTLDADAIAGYSSRGTCKCRDADDAAQGVLL